MTDLTSGLSPQKNARIAGLLYLVNIITGIFALMYVPGKLIVATDAAKTFKNITESETLFRLGILDYLVYKSGFLPKFLGIFLIAGCFGYLIDFTCNFLFTGYNKMTISSFVAIPASIGEIGICLWLLIMGVKKQQTA